MADLKAQTTAVLQQLIRTRTVNPPGAEREAQEWLAAYLEEAGLECRLLARDPERPNLVARLPGRSDGPTLCYLGHVDTVLATPDDWSRDPWCGDLEDGLVWGRGAQDMKSQVAAEAVAAAELARSGWRPPAGDLMVVAVADEEAGGAFGAKWLTEEHPDVVRCDMLVNEGGGTQFELDGTRRYPVCCAEKGVFRFTLATAGTAGHASTPGVSDNALLKMAPLIERLGAHPLVPEVVEAPRAALRVLDGDGDGDPMAALERLRERDPRVAALVEPTLGVTFAPTRIHASDKINVVPARAELQVDCRVPPGLEEADVRALVAEVLEGLDYELSIDEQVVGNASPPSSPLMDAIGAWVSDRDPGAQAIPAVLPAFTDSRWFRAAFPECVAYGFFPQREMSIFETWPLVHGADERIDERDLGFAADFFHELPQRVLA